MESPDLISDADLMRRMAEFMPSSKIPPVTDSTRHLLRRRLKALEGERRDDKTPAKSGTKRPRDDEANGAKPSSPSHRTSVNLAPAHQQPLRTLVFLDLEATGLAKSFPRTRITELSLVSVSEPELHSLKASLQAHVDGPNGGRVPVDAIVPRVTNRLTLCFYPGTVVPPEVIGITGLDNFNLEDQQRFSAESGQMISQYLSRLAKPVCLVAHNGSRFDFPLLLAEMSRACVALGDDVFCVDSLEALRSIYKEEGNVKIGGDELSALDDHFNDDFVVDVAAEDGVCGYREQREKTQTASVNSTPVKNNGAASYSLPAGAFSSHSKNYEIPLTPPTPSIKKPRVGDGSPAIAHQHCLQQPQPTPPPSTSSSSSSSFVAPAADLIKDENEVTPDKMIPVFDGPPPAPKVDRTRKAALPHVRSNKARKRLDFSRQQQQTSSSQPPQSFSLARLHEHIFGREPLISHGAEQDCLALMRVCAAKSDTLLPHFQDNRTSLNSLTKMW